MVIFDLIQMNIFFLHRNPKTNAQYHCDKHVVKMLLEAVQILYCAHWMTDPDGIRWKVSCRTKTKTAKLIGPYKKAHPNHPCSIWVRESISNYKYLCLIAMSLCEEYTFRYSKIHGCQIHLNWLIKNIPQNIKCHELTNLPIVIKGNEIKNPILAYRNYYNTEKKRFAKWSKRSPPPWFSPKDTF